MTRTSISLSNDLIERLKPLKKQLNISGICQTALESKVHLLEQIQIALSNEDVMAGLIERLKVQKIEALDQSRAWGEEDGQQWMIRYATYQDGKKWGGRTRHFRPARNKYEREHSADFSEHGYQGFEIFIPEDDETRNFLETRRKQSEINDLPFEIQPYSVGFRDAVRAIWTQIEKDL